ncbi:phage holin family protein [Brachybacterium endophyticum]|uniref:Phage holin family protein n=1 Tax=Brachybacterium endophyticum TaxID=2182385 RepID=A0A2U2RL03_9MICO|nr:phage holin family protein [Brachybacterium endophyticum]PWH06543.1 phage holin family protein [Brachybacterium endophyticum]
MFRFLGHLIIVAVALWLTSLLLPGMHLGGGEGTLVGQVLTVVGVALIFAIVDAIVKPILSFLALPLTCLTLGLFMLVINAVLLLLTSWVAGWFGLPLAFDGFWWALLAGVIVGVLSSVFEAILGADGGRDRADA